MNLEKNFDQSFDNIENWDNHAFNDDCSGLEISNMGLLLGFKEHIKNTNNLEKAGKLLNKYLTNPNRMPIKTFKNGEEFNANIYPHGTIIRYELSKLSSKLGTNKDKLKEIYWGVVIDKATLGLLETAIVSFKQTEMINNKVKFQSGIQLEPVINVGVTDHQREFKNGKLIFQSFEKVDWLQKMSTGKGVAVSLPYRSNFRKKELKIA